MRESLLPIRSEFFSFYTDNCGNNGTNLTVWRPVREHENSRIAVLAVHRSNYMNFAPMKEMAKRGFTAAGVSLKPRRRGRETDAPAVWTKEVSTCVDFLRSLPGVDKVVLMAHSQGGCMLSAYQYIAENGTARFTETDRLIPFPEISGLSPADGLILMDGNYGIMKVLALDPAVRSLDNGYTRIPELDLYNPDNGYDPAVSNQTYPDDFVQRFQRAQIDYYRHLLAYAKQRYEIIRSGRGHFEENEIMFIPGAAGGSHNNKLFNQDRRFLGRTAKPRRLLHADGTITEEIVYTNRKSAPSTPSSRYGGGFSTTVVDLLEDEVRFFDDYAYGDCWIRGLDERFNYLSTRENVKAIHVPLLCQGNQASHEFVNMEITYEMSASADKEYLALAGSCHDYTPVTPEYGDVLGAVCDYFEQWLCKPGRFE